eukprot:494923-Hanusia_phi.AAC.5
MSNTTRLYSVPGSAPVGAFAVYAQFNTDLAESGVSESVRQSGNFGKQHSEVSGRRLFNDPIRPFNVTALLR